MIQKCTVLLFILILALPLYPGKGIAIQGWEPDSDLRTYVPGSLWEVINGAAEQFLDYGFQELTVQDVKSGDLVITVYIYDMGNALNAYGMYMAERSPGAAGLNIGTESVLALPYQAILLKDRYYVKADVFDGELDESAGIALLSAIADALPGGTGRPDILEKLPSDARMQGTEGYAKKNFLGLAELNECVYAEYQENDSTVCRIFVMTEGDPDSVWNALAATWDLSQIHESPVLHRDIPYQGPVGVIQTEEGILGVTDVPSKEALFTCLEKFLPK